MHKATIFRNPIYICIMTNERHTSIHSQRQKYGKIEFQIAHSLWIEFRNDFNRKVFMWRSQKKNLSRSLYLRVAENFIRHGIFNTLNSCAQLVLRSVHFFSSLFSLYQMAIVFVFVYKHEKRCCWCLSARVLVFPLLVQSFVFEMRSQTVVCGGSLWLQAIYMNLSLLQLPECV